MRAASPGLLVGDDERRVAQRPGRERASHRVAIRAADDRGVHARALREGPSLERTQDAQQQRLSGELVERLPPPEPRSFPRGEDHDAQVVDRAHGCRALPRTP